MFLRSLNQQQKEAFLELAHLVAKSDGNICKHETRILDEYKVEMSLSEHYELREITIEEILSHYSDYQSRNIVFLEILSLASIDGNYDEMEQSVIATLIEHFNFDEQKYMEYKTWIEDYRSIYVRGQVLLEMTD